MKRSVGARFAAILFASLAAGPSCADQPADRDNVLIDVSSALVNALVPGDLDQTQRQRDVILNTPIIIAARTRGKGRAVLVPDANNAVIDFMLTGYSLANLVAIPADQDLYIYLNSATSFSARKRIYANSAGLAAYPAQSKATVNIRLDRVTTTGGASDTPLTNLAEGYFEARREQFERASAKLTEDQLNQQLDSQFGPTLAQANNAYRSGLGQIRSAGIPLRTLRFSTSLRLLSVGAEIALPNGPHTQLAPPPRLGGNFDLGLRVHQSAVNDGAQAALAGKTFSVDAMFGQQPLQSPTITFADQQPIWVIFADHGCKLTVNVKELRAAGLRLPGLKVQVEYQLVSGRHGVEAVRQGPVRVSPYYHHQLGGQVVGALLEARLSTVFKERIPVPTITPPASLSAIGTLVPTQADAGNGWICATWVRKR